MKTRDTAGKVSRSILKWTRIAWVWGLSRTKMEFLKCKLGRARRNLDRRNSRLGAEFYSLYMQGETEFLKSLVVRQQLKIVEEAELRVLAVHDRLDAVEKEFLGRWETIAREDAGKDCN